MAKQQKHINNPKITTQRPKSNSISVIISSVVLAVVISLISVKYFFQPSKIAYVETSRLMISFSEANKIERELKEEDEKWRKELKIYEDTLQAAVDDMTKEYNTAKPARKKVLQDLLSAHNQQLNNFKQANLRKMDKLRKEKMQNIVNKINAYIKEYGKKHKYNIIFGTSAGGSILYGGEGAYDITEDIIKGLNERYK